MRRRVPGKSEAGEAVVDFTSPVISLGGCNVDAALCGEVCSVLHDNEVVSTLDFSRNGFGDDGAEHVAKLIAANKGVVSLNLSHNSITDAGVVILVRAARRHATLQSLNLAGNPIGDAALHEVVRLVAVSDQLSELVLLDTSVTIRGALDLAEAMVNNFSLTLVSLPFSLGFTVLDEVQRLLMRNYARITKLDDEVRRAVIESQVQQETRENRRRHWKSTQPAAEPTSSRVHTVEASLNDWTDASQRSTLMNLNLLDKRAKEVSASEARAKKLADAPRGKGLGGVSPRALASVHVSPRGSARGTPRGTFMTSASAVGSGAATPRFMALPPLPDCDEGFTASFRTKARRC